MLVSQKRGTMKFRGHLDARHCQRRIWSGFMQASKRRPATQWAEEKAAARVCCHMPTPTLGLILFTQPVPRGSIVLGGAHQSGLYKLFIFEDPLGATLAA